jgi:hypothetical protein
MPRSYRRSASHATCRRPPVSQQLLARPCTFVGSAGIAPERMHRRILGILSALSRVLAVVFLLYASWLAMMAIHELGHVLHAWLSGGTVSLVYLRPFEFSRTDLSVNPHPQFVAWGGPLWGCVIPLT